MKSILTLMLSIFFLLTIFVLNINMASSIDFIQEPVNDTGFYQTMASAGAGLGIFANNIALPLANFLLIEFLIIVMVVIVTIALVHIIRHFIVYVSQS